MSTPPSDPAIARLHSIPWDALDSCLDVALHSIQRSLAGQPAERILDRALRRLSSTQRRAVAEATFGVSLWRRRLAFHLGLTNPLLAPPKLLLFSLLRDLAGLPTPHAASLVSLQHAELPPHVPGPPADFALRHSLPDWLAHTLQLELGPDAEPFAHAINLPGPVCLRVNSLLTSRDALQARLLTEGVRSSPGRWAPTALVVLDQRPNLLALPSYREGLFEVQDEGSQLLAALVDAQPGEVVFDACAGAGGKTLALAAQLQNRGELHAYDPDPERLQRLRTRAARAGVSCLHVHSSFPDGLSADRVLVDAPCSELGPLRRGPDRRFLIRPEEFPEVEQLQRRILRDASALVRPGGVLVYATCTLRREENELVARELEHELPALSRVQPSLGEVELSFFRDGYFRSWPHVHGTDAFFAACWFHRP